MHNLRLTADSASLHLQVAWQGDPPPEPKVRTTGVVGFQQNSAEMVVHLSDGTQRSMSIAEYQRITAAQAARNVSVQLSAVVNATCLTQTVTPPSDGPYANDIPAGDYTVSVGPSATCCYVKEMAFNGVPFADGKMHLAAGTSGTLRILVSAGGGTLHCKAPDATIVLLREGDTGNPQIRPSPATWENLAPGKFRVLAVTGPVSFPEDLDKLRAALFQGKEVEITARATLDITLDPISLN